MEVDREYRENQGGSKKQAGRVCVIGSAPNCFH
jgi:hypothetical protein